MLCLLPQRKQHDTIRSVWNLETSHLTPGILLQPTYWACPFWVGPRARWGSAAGPNGNASGLPLQPNDQVDHLMLVEMSMVGKRPSMELIAASGQESQHRLLEFWSKAMPTAVENFMTFEKQCLEYCLGTDRTHDYEVPSDLATGTSHCKLSSAGPTKSYGEIGTAVVHWKMEMVCSQLSLSGISGHEWLH